MKWNEQTQQEARKLVETLTPAQWKTVCETIPVLMQPISPEARKADQERREKQVEYLKADYMEKSMRFDEMDKKINNGVAIPERYEWSYDEVSPLFQLVYHPLATHDDILHMGDAMFTLGFKYGMACQKKRNKA